MLAPIAIGMVGLQFALFTNGLALLGIDAAPAGEGGLDPAKSIGVAGSWIAAISLLFMSFFLLIGAPFGTEGLAAEVQIMFSAISGMYGFLFLGFGIVQVRGWDLRPVGNAALGAAIMQVIEVIIIAARWGLDLNNIITEIVLLIYVVALVGFWRTTHGELQPRTQGWLLLLAWLGTFYFLFWSGGLLPVPGS
ncbi:MAG: hypothetical protein M5U01_38005 [Ardenticatenaceae bacterium]|nr:hypothetical protein [Ardenticatenaceae bacterium]HBY97107.1 hypothetical protein [Chloroflexota bacterium]